MWSASWVCIGCWSTTSRQLRLSSGNKACSMPTRYAESLNTLDRPLRLLIADDDPEDIDLCLHSLRKSGIPFEAQSVTTPEQLSEKLQTLPVDIVLSDYRMRGWTGMDALSLVRQLQPGTPLILMSGTLGDELAVESIKAGVTDYVLKGQLARLPMALLRAYEERTLKDAESRALEALRESEQHYRTLIQNAPEAIVVLDVDRGTFVDCNDKAVNLFRFSREELLHKGPQDLSPAVQPNG